MKQGAEPQIFQLDRNRIQLAQQQVQKTRKSKIKLKNKEILVRNVQKIRTHQLSYFLHRHLHNRVSACVKVSSLAQKVIQNQIADKTGHIRCSLLSQQKTTQIGNIRSPYFRIKAFYTITYTTVQVIVQSKLTQINILAAY